MEPISTLIKQQEKKLKQNSSNSQIEAGLTKTHSISRDSESSESSSTPDVTSTRNNKLDDFDYIDAVSNLFAKFEYSYHNQYHKAFPNPKDLVIAKKFWGNGLKRYSPAQIIAAGEQAIRTQKFLPTIADIVSFCEQLDSFGLPTLRQAYLEACTAPSPKSAFSWSHAAVYYAGKAAGWHLLANEPESVALPVFEYQYERMCRRVMEGEELSLEAPQAIPEKIDKKLSAEELRKRLAKLRKELNL